MTDTTLVFKVTVLGSILAAAVGQNYFYTNARFNPRRVRPYFVQQPTVQVIPQRQPGLFFVGANQMGAQPNPNANGGYYGGPQVSGTLVSGTLGGVPLQIGPGVQELMASTPSPVVTTTANPPVTTTSTTTTPLVTTTEITHTQKLANVLVNAIIRNHELRMMKTTTTTPSPLGLGPSGITGEPQGTHTHPFLHGQPGVSGNSQVIVHSHGQNQQPHVHIDHTGAQPTNSRVIARGNTQQTEVPNVLSAAPGATNTHSTRSYNNQLHAPNSHTYLPHFLTGGNKENLISRQVNSTLLRPTSISRAPVRRQIPPPSRPTIPTQPNTNPSRKVFEEEEEEEEEETRGGRTSVLRQSITELTPPNTQIPAPMPLTPRQPTTSQEPRGTSASTTSSASTPTTIPVPYRTPGQL